VVVPILLVILLFVSVTVAAFFVASLVLSTFPNHKLVLAVALSANSERLSAFSISQVPAQSVPLAANNSQ